MSCGWFPLPPGEILAWVEEHRDSLPTTLAELSAFPVAFQAQAKMRTLEERMSKAFTRQQAALIFGMVGPPEPPEGLPLPPGTRLTPSS